MELYKIIRNVIELTKVKTFDIKFVNILSDFSAYQDYPSAKYIFKVMAEDGFFVQLVNHGKYDSDCTKMAQQFANKTGFQHENVVYSIKCLAYGLGWIDDSFFTEHNRPQSKNPEVSIKSEAPEATPAVNKPIQRVFWGIELLSTRQEVKKNLENKGIAFEDNGFGSISIHDCSFGGVDWAFAILSFNDNGHFSSIVFDAMFGSYSGGSSEVRTYKFLKDHLLNAYSQYITFDGTTDIGFEDGHTSIQLELKVDEYGTSVNLYYFDKDEDEPKKGFENSNAFEL